MVNFNFALEATTLYNQILGWLTDPQANILKYGVVPASHLSIVPINRRSNEQFPREFTNVASRTRFFTNKGETNIVAPTHRNVPGRSVTAESRVLESVNANNNEYLSMDFDEVTYKPSESSIWHYRNLLETAARTLQREIDVNYFATWSEDQLVDGTTNTSGAADGVIDYTITTDLTTQSEATANALVYEISRQIDAIQETAPGDSTDNFVVHVPFSVISYLRAFFKRAVVRSITPHDASRPAQDYATANALNIDGLLYVGYDPAVLGSSTTPVGTYGYINHRTAIKIDFSDRNDPMYAVDMTRFAGSQSFFEAIMSEMNRKGLMYDSHAQKILADLQANKGFYVPGASLSGNIYRVAFYPLASDIDNFGMRIDTVMRPTRLMPQGMRRLIFDDTLAPLSLGAPLPAAATFATTATTAKTAKTAK